MEEPASSGSVERGPFPDELRSGHPPVVCVDDRHTLVSAVVLTHRDGHLHALLWFWVFLKRQEKKKKARVGRGGVRPYLPSALPPARSALAFPLLVLPHPLFLHPFS